MNATRGRCILVCALVAGLARPASARIPIVETDDVQLYFGGYLRSFTAWQVVDDSVVDLTKLLTPDSVFEELGLQSTIGRAEFKLSALDLLTFEVHSRWQWNVASQPILGEGSAGFAGAGVSVEPTRSVDLSSDIIKQPNHSVNHDLDRLLLRFYFGEVDMSVGRQALTWGNSTLFSVADIWTTFSPFDLDTSQKRGIDALRVVWGVTDKVELDFLVADRGSVEDISGGVRANIYLPFGDLYVAAAKNFEDVALATGLSASIDTVKMRGEVMGRFDIDNKEFELPRATLGVDWFPLTEFIMGVEAHFNGYGTQDADTAFDYLSFGNTSEAHTRGEAYLLGRWYAGAYFNYRPHELVNITTSVMVNLTDPTALITWGLSYEVAASVDLGLGGLHGVGDGFELGAFGQMLYLQMAAYL